MTKLTAFVAITGLAWLAGCSSPTPCNNVHDCPAGERCASKQCQNVGASPGVLGDSCNADSDCGGGLSCNPLSIGFPAGYCTVSCTGTCATGACAALSSGSSICAPTCAADTDCRKDYLCCATSGNVCLPSGACTPAACERPIATSALPAAQVVELGSHKVGDEVSFAVPANTGSITILHQASIAGLEVVANGSAFDNSAVPLTVTRPDGSQAYNDNTSSPSSADGGTDNSGQFAMFGGGQGSTAAFTMPNTSASLAAGIAAGTWKFVVNDYANECANGAGCSDGGTTADTYDVSVLLRPLPAGSNLDVNFYIVGNATNGAGQLFTAANAPNDPSVKRMVKTFTSLYAAASITVRTVTFYDVPDAAKSEYGTNVSADATGPCDLLDQMFTLSGAHAANTINLFLVQSIRQSSSGGAGGTVVGVDGSIPGPSTLSGTVHSGAAVSLADLFQNTAFCSGGLNLGSCGPDRVAYIAAHETGHFLGMFHTTEMEGADFDPLTDTAKCPCLPCASATDQPKCGSSQASGQAFVTAQRCSGGSSSTCGGGDNLMFWLLDESVSQGSLSPQQSQVMRLNPVVQP